MNGRFLNLAITSVVGALLFSNSSTAQFHGPQSLPPQNQILPPLKRAERVEITKTPELEAANSWTAIVRWTTTNPRGLDEHYGVVHYGTDPEDLRQTAKGHIRLNRAHPETIFRVRLQGLQPQTTYYYKVTSEDSAGRSDGVEGSVSHFTTPPPGEVINNYPQPKS
jgi:Purple acid Phosphatase, N-terminal domain